MQRYIKCYTPVSALLEMLLVTVLYVFVGIEAGICHILTSSKQYDRAIKLEKKLTCIACNCILKFFVHRSCKTDTFSTAFPQQAWLNIHHFVCLSSSSSFLETSCTSISCAMEPCTLRRTICENAGNLFALVCCVHL